jgi:hypothetical protein
MRVLLQVAGYIEAHTPTIPLCNLHDLVDVIGRGLCEPRVSKTIVQLGESHTHDGRGWSKHEKM